MSRKKIIALVVVVFLLWGIFSLAGLFWKKSGDKIETLLTVIALIKSQYYQPVSTEKLINGAIKGMVEGLDDPYSTYLDPEQFKHLNEQITGTFGGVGLIVTMEENHIVVVKPIPDTPAAKAGIKAGDIIVNISGRDTKGMDLDTAVSLMRGPVGTRVEVGILRPGEKETRMFTLVRENITIPTVESKMLDDKIGYIMLSQFTENSPQAVRKAIGDLKKKGMKGLIFDLRDNPGGELKAAVEIADIFVPRGKTIVYVDYRNQPDEEEKAEVPELGIPVVVLVNGGSASASEIVAGALKDWGVAVLVGEKTFGKGVVQSIFRLPGNAGLKLTVARYLTPKKHDINKKGIMPDVVVKQPAGSKEDRQLLKAKEILAEKIK
ncbi:S41 family peptidase [Carboxydothermus hydrogenoformans]|uniref:Carboxyl-terminal protease n=1 Tax=Carboxydothermus hydrogenoformans (strain ATCC BAA-161 / DSM 6008 / Z-2901) TaxID=246194 RepID=Q3AFP2_CARHZ|nr:S41 family peptidase [Carboxydothermus hydrogenoformans]ABB13884.1 carboxyl-terminal protease [Carboxydothermus hydrogenoformans Z-2901]